MLAGRADDGVKKYKIAGQTGGSRELERYSMAELLDLLNYWKRRAAKEAAPGRLGGPRIVCYL